MLTGSSRRDCAAAMASEAMPSSPDSASTSVGSIPVSVSVPLARTCEATTTSAVVRSRSSTAARAAAKARRPAWVSQWTTGAAPGWTVEPSRCGSTPAAWPAADLKASYRSPSKAGAWASRPVQASSSSARRSASSTEPLTRRDVTDLVRRRPPVKTIPGSRSLPQSMESRNGLDPPHGTCRVSQPRLEPRVGRLLPAQQDSR